MAQYQDNFGRNHSFGMDADALRNLLSSSMKENVKSQPFSSSKNPVDINSLTNLLSSTFKDFQSQFNDVLRKFNNVVSEYKKSQAPRQKSDVKADVEANKSMRKLANKGLKKGSIYVHDTHCEHVLKEIHKLLAGKRRGAPTLAPMPTGGGSGGSGGRGGPTPSAGGSWWDNFFGNNTNALNKANKDLEKTFTFNTVADKIDAALTGIFEKNPFDQMFDGVIKDEFKFMQQMRQTLYSTQGLTAENAELQKQWEHIEDAVTKTGFRREVFQKAYVKQLGKGIKDQKTLNRLVTTELNLEKQLGVEAGSMSEIFDDWTQNFMLSQDSIAEMSRGIKDIAKTSGLTGENLTKAVKSSQNVMKSLDNAGNLTIQASKNIMSVMAQAQKLGVGPEAEKFLQGMTSLGNFTDASPGIQSLLARTASRAGLQNELMMGTLTKDRKNFSKMSGSLFSEISMIAGQEIKSVKDLAKLPDEMKRRLDMVYKDQGGFKVVAKLAEATETAGQSYEEQISKLQMKRNDRFTGDNERKAIDEQILELETRRSTENISNVSQEMDFGHSMTEALNKSGITSDDLRQSFSQSVNKLNVDAEKYELDQIDPARIEEAMRDPTQYKGLTEQINELEQKVSESKRSDADPVSKIQNAVDEINESLKQGIFPWLQDWGGAMLSGMMVLSGASKAWGLLKMIPGIGNAVFGKGGIIRGIRAAMAGRAGLGGGAGGGVLSKSLGWMKTLGKVAAPLALLSGAYSGATDHGGRGAVAGGALGLLTGDAKTGGVFGQMGMVKKGGVADELLGIGGAAARGAAIGMIFGPVGAAIGGGIGALAETFKIMTNEDSPIRKGLLYAGNKVSEYFSDLGGFISEKWTNLKSKATDFWNWMTDAKNPHAHTAASVGAGAIGGVAPPAPETSQVSPSIVHGMAATALLGPAAGLAIGSLAAPSLDVGSRMISKSGFAKIHEGELVVPKDMADQVLAQSSGSFNTLLDGEKDVASLIARDQVQVDAVNTSSELNLLGQEAETQTQLQNQMVTLLGQLLQAMQSGGAVTLPSTSTSRPTKYYQTGIGSNDNATQNYGR